MSYLNFAVEVSSLPDGRYRISVASPVGEASADVDNPFTTQDIQDAVAVLGRTRRVPRAEENDTARRLGERLFEFLIRSSDDINAAYYASLERAGSAGLRIRLTVEGAGELHALPWEYLRDPNRDFLALSRSTPIVRYTPQLNIRPPVPIKYPLRVLVMISAPSDFPELDVEGEWVRLNEATADLRARGLMVLERLDSATLIALQRRLRSAEYHIFHFIGHSDYDAVSGQGVLVFERESDESKGQIISGASLGRELGEENSLRLVVLNSCHSARRPDSDALAGISSSIVARGVPAVVAMQFAISDGAAKAFAEEFYRVLAEMSPIDTAVSEARRAIANRMHNIEWGTPVLYMRSESGVLFRSASSTETRPVQRRIEDTTPSTQRPPHAQPKPSRMTLLIGGVGALFALAIIVGLLRVVIPPPPPPTPTDEPTPMTDPAALPDLQIGTMRISPRQPAPGQIFILNITLTNAGSADSGPFSWAWDASPTLLDALEGRVDNIPPGASKNISFPFSYGWWGEYNSLINVDVESEVEEGEERNNRHPFLITLAKDQPFQVDFSLLPNNTLVETPFRLGGDDFIPWNLDFTLGSMAAGCLNAPIDLIDVDNDVILSASADADSSCAEETLNITIIRAPVGAAQVELMPLQSGSATVTYYANPSGGTPILRLPTEQVTVGEPIIIGVPEPQGQLIRRIEIDMGDQPVRLSRLILFPIPDNP